MGERTLNRRWRLIVSDPAPGAWNMALDEALAESVRQGAPPFLRFYFWEPAALSLGRFQNLQDGLTDRARTVPLVRRPTGGGGIWHADELTYSLGCTQNDLGISGVKASFEKLCAFLIDTWRELGWNASFAKDGSPLSPLGAFTPACFAGQEEYDVVVDGRKLGGNAQRRDRSTIFQHGSIPRNLDHERLAELFLPGFRPDPAATTDLHRCGWRGEARDLIPRLARNFQKRLAAEAEEAEPTVEEQERAHELVGQRFADPVWTEQGSGRLRAD